MKKFFKWIYETTRYVTFAVVAWIGAVLSGSDKASSKRLAFLAVVTAGIVWLSSALHHAGMTEQWVISFQTLVAFASGSYLVGSGIDRLGKKKKDESTEE